MDFKRLSSALLGLPMVIVVLLFGNKYVIDAALSIVAIISLHEYFNAFKEKHKPIKWIGYLLAFLICFIHLISPEQLFMYIGLSIPFIVVILFIELIFKNLKINIVDIAITLFGIFYIVLFTMFIPLLAGAQDGKMLVWYVLINAWGTDIFAYAVGRRIGKHKFSKISPNKSIEGCIAGTIGAIILTIIYTIILNTRLNFSINYFIVSIMALILSLIGQVGDFAASSIKRYNGVKDFSNLIPGHGGILDRFDSLIFIAPFAYFLLMLL